MTKGYVYVLLTALAFSTYEVASKLIANQLDPFQLTFLRFLIGGLVLLPFAIYDLKAKKLKLHAGDFLFLALTGFLGIGVSMSFMQLGIKYAPASTAAVLFSTNPVFTVPFAYLILRESVNRKMIGALVISLVGIACFFRPESLVVGGRGIYLSLSAAFSFSLYSVVGKLRVERYGGLVLNCFSFLLGILFLVPYLLWANIPVVSGINSGNIIHVLYVGIFVTGCGYLFYFLAMKAASAGTAATAFFIKPALAPLLSWIILGETITPATVAGILLIMAGAVLMLRSKPGQVRSKNPAQFKSPQDGIRQ